MFSQQQRERTWREDAVAGKNLSVASPPAHFAGIQPRGWLSASRLHGQVIWCAATSCLQTQHVCKAAGKTAQQTEVLQLSNSPWTFTLLAPRL